MLNEEPPLVSTVASQPIPEALDRLVQACVAKRREDRPASAAELIEVLDALRQDHRWTQDEARQCWESAARPEQRAA